MEEKTKGRGAAFGKVAVKQPGKHEVRVCEAAPWKEKTKGRGAAFGKVAVKQPEKHEVPVCEALIV